MQKQHLVFVYGTLLRGLSNHSLLAEARFLGAARTKELYALYADTFPKVIRETGVVYCGGTLSGGRPDAGPTG